MVAKVVQSNTNSVVSGSQSVGNATNPISAGNEIEKPSELASREYSQATRALAMAQIMTGEKLSSTTTPNEYTAQLIKQGQIPDKNFRVSKSKDGIATYVEELNSKGQALKRTIFSKSSYDSKPYVSHDFINPETDREYKSISYDSDGSVRIYNCDPETGKLAVAESYDSNGNLDSYRTMVEKSGCEIEKYIVPDRV